MKKTLPITLIALFFASRALAVGGSIGIFSSSTATSCAIQQPSVNSSWYIAIVHTGTDGAAGSEFSAPMPACAGGVVIVDVPYVYLYVPYILGAPAPSQVGVFTGYNSCKRT
jgi:hypothetical protein